FRKKNISTLYFSIYCFIIGIRILVIDDYYLTDLFPSAPFELGNKLSYLTFYLGVPSLAIFVHSLYPEDFSKYVVRAYMFLGGVFSLIVLFSKSIFYAEFLIYYQLATLLIILYSIYFIVLILLRKREGSMTFTIGILTIFITATNDILYTNLLIQTANIIPFGLFVFIFSQTLILSKKFSLAFNRVEELSEALQKNNDQLEEIVGQRTAELNELNLALAQNLEELRSNIDMINAQNKEIKAQHHSITSSINYAKNIQSNILPDFQHIQAHFPDSFLIFRAKDIVSGDFYYFNQKQNKFVLAAVDCTGHGVPGAFMSLIGYEILTEIIEHYHLMEPSHILKRLHLGIKKLLKQGESTSNSRDGMDIALVVIDMEKKELLFAGAKTPLVYIENGKMKMIDGDNLHIGGINSKDSIEFQQTTLPFGDKENFSFYLFSDGYQDQFGGEQNKKLMKRHFRELLFQLHAMPMKEQGDLLLEWHEAWKGNIAQTDDILVMGLRLK
nr:SpoIIE family protein phosphatase [Thermoflexibacter sp.]